MNNKEIFINFVSYIVIICIELIIAFLLSYLYLVSYNYISYTYIL